MHVSLGKPIPNAEPETSWLIGLLCLPDQCRICNGFWAIGEVYFCFLESSVSRIYTLLRLCRTFRSLFIMQKKPAHIGYGQRVGVVKRARPCRCKLFVRSEIALCKCVLGQYSAPYILKLKWIALRCRPCANNLTDYAQKLSTKKPLSLKIWRFLARSPQNNAKVIHHLLTLCITFVDNFTPLSVITRYKKKWSVEAQVCILYMPL